MVLWNIIAQLCSPQRDSSIVDHYSSSSSYDLLFVLPPHRNLFEDIMAVFLREESCTQADFNAVLTRAHAEGSPPGTESEYLCVSRRSSAGCTEKRVVRECSRVSLISSKLLRCEGVIRRRGIWWRG